jgi:hypothetical protein
MASLTSLILSLWLIGALFMCGESLEPLEDDTAGFDHHWTADCAHYNYRQDIPQPGMHILCVKSAGNSSINVSVLKDGVDEIEFQWWRDW